MLTVKVSNEDYVFLKKESKNNPSSIVRKRCDIILVKHAEPKFSCQRIATLLDCCRNTVRNTLHVYNTEGINSVLKIMPKPGRPGKLKEHMEKIDQELDNRLPKSVVEARHIIEETTGIKMSISRTRQILYKLGNKCRKMQPIPGNADPKKQKEWIKNLQPIINEAKTGARKLLFMDAVHYTLGSFACYVWSKQPVFLPTGAGRNRFNVLGAIDPFTLDLIESHGMTYVDAEQTMQFLEKVRAESEEIPVSIVLDNARYQHCPAVMEKAEELNIQLIFLPPYSPNLNIIERLWKYTRRHVLAGNYFSSPAKFHAALRYFYEEDIHNHKSNLESLLTLNFQSFENAHLLCA